KRLISVSDGFESRTSTIFSFLVVLSFYGRYSGLSSDRHSGSEPSSWLLALASPHSRPSPDCRGNPHSGRVGKQQVILMVHNYDDDKKYVTHEFDDECGQHTTGATWNYGGEYFFCTFRCRVPRRIADKSHLVDECSAVTWRLYGLREALVGE